MELSGLARCVAFAGDRRIAAGRLADVAVAAKAAVDRGAEAPVLLFDGETGQTIDVDFRGTAAEVAARLGGAGTPGRRPDETPRGRGRPKLGVVAREVTLLPRHWEWLNRQPGGASVALRRLVEQARRDPDGRDRRRRAQEGAYRFMSAMAGDQPGFEEAARALFAGDRARFERWTEAWPEDVRSQAAAMATAAFAPEAVR